MPRKSGRVHSIDLGFSHHVYCLVGGGGGGDGNGALPTNEFGLGDGAGEEANATACDEVFETRNQANALDYAAQNDVALFITEFGASDNLELIDREVSEADAVFIGWQYWAYYALETCCPDDFVDTLIIDQALPPTADNIKLGKLAVLSRPYPKRIAGTPISQQFELATARYQFSYNPQRVDGLGRFDAAVPTIVYVPLLHYPNGFELDIEGGQWRATADAQHYHLFANPDAQQVSIELRPKP